MNSPHTEPQRLTVDYHDGRTAQAQTVVIWVAQGMLELAGHGILRQIPIHHVQWPDPARQEDVRIVLLPGGGSLRGHDPALWDAWQGQQTLSPAATSAFRHSWRWSLVATLLLLALCTASYVFALPAPSRG